MNDEQTPSLTRAELAATRKLLRSVDLRDQQIDDDFVRATRAIILRGQAWKILADFSKGWFPWIALAMTVLAFLRPSILTWLFGGAS